MILCSLDIPLQVLTRPFYIILNRGCCKLVLQWLLIIPHHLLSASCYMFCEILPSLGTSYEGLYRCGSPGSSDDSGFNQMSKATRGQVSVERSQNMKFDPNANCKSHARGLACDIFVYLRFSDAWLTADVYHLQRRNAF